jgi:hypothetical protein
VGGGLGQDPSHFEVQIASARNASEVELELWAELDVVKQPCARKERIENEAR